MTFILNLMIFSSFIAHPSSDSLKEILKIMGIDPNLPKEQIVSITQKKWLCSGERAGIKDSDELAEKRDQLMPHFEALGMIKTIEPNRTHYASVLVLGSKIRAVEKRLESVLERINQGMISIDTLYMLGGERKLDDDEKAILQEMGLFAEDEREMVELVAVKMIPNGIDYQVIKASKKEGAMRATTVETIQAWLDQDPKSPTLLVSSQPYGHYQLLASKNVVPDSISLDVLAVETKETRVAIFLDTLARMLFLL